LNLTITPLDELIEKCRCGDEIAQMTVYNNYSKAMFNTALRIVKNHEEAEDIMQEAFILAFNKISTFKGTASFGAWLKKIVINQSLSAYHQKKRLQEVPFCDQSETIIDDEAEFIQDNEANGSKVKHLLKALHTLKPNYRIILMLHLIEGYDYEEICEIMRISPANCRTTISRAKASLRHKLLDHANK
jgi:RNA polymerase sigma factor (sigma-70 family)